MKHLQPQKRAPVPFVTAPSLRDLRLTLQTPGPVTKEELEGRLAAALMERAARAPLRRGALASTGDEVVWDAVAYCNGRLVPFFAREGSVTAVGPSADFPGMGEALGKIPVGSSAVVELALPTAHPLPAFRGKRATLLVDVTHATQVRLPPIGEAATLQALGRGATLARVFETLAEEALAARRAAAWDEARHALASELVARSGWRPPRELVDDEVLARWQHAEGSVLARKSVPADDVTASRDAWLLNDEVRGHARDALVLLATCEALVREGAVPKVPAQTQDPLAFVLDALLPEVTATHRPSEKLGAP